MLHEDNWFPYIAFILLLIGIMMLDISLDVKYKSLMKKLDDIKFSQIDVGQKMEEK